jgi:hypothetical protein
MNPNGVNKTNAEMKDKILERFYSGQTKITELAHEFGLSRNTVCRIVKSDQERYEQVISLARKEAALKRKEKQKSASQKCKQQKRYGNSGELASAICQYFWAIKCTDDDWGICSEIEVAKHFQISQAEAIKALKTDPEYRELERHREFVVTHNMEELHRQDTAEMSKHSRLSGTQAVMLNLNAYRLSKSKKAFVYNLKTGRPWDMPKRLSTKLQRLDICKDETQKAKAEEWNSETEQQAIKNSGSGYNPKDPKGGGGGQKKKKKKHKKKK